MSDAPQEKAEKEKKFSIWEDVIFPLIDAENIINEAPTLKVASDAMRSLFACVAMLGGCVFLFLGGFGFSFAKWIAVVIGIWVAIYALLAVCQVWTVMLSGLFHLAHFFWGKALFEKHTGIVVLLIYIPATLVWFGLLFIIGESILRIMQK